MGAVIGRWAPLVGGLLLAASVILPIFGESELAKFFAALAASTGFGDLSPVPPEEFREAAALTLAAVASLVGIVRKLWAVYQLSSGGGNVNKYAKRVGMVAAAVLSAQLASAQTFEGFMNPGIYGGASYNETTEKFSALITANVPGVKLGDWNVYLSGVGVSLNTIAPGLEDVSIAAASFPLVTAFPFGERVSFQVGLSIPLSGGEKSYYAAVGVSVESPNTLRAKRVQRAKAKAQQKALQLQDEIHRPGVAASPKPAEDPHQEVPALGVQ